MSVHSYKTFGFVHFWEWRHRDACLGTAVVQQLDSILDQCKQKLHFCIGFQKRYPSQVSYEIWNRPVLHLNVVFASIEWNWMVSGSPLLMKSVLSKSKCRWNYKLSWEWDGLIEKVTHEFVVLDSKDDLLQHHLPQSHFETATILILTMITPRQILVELLQQLLQPTLRISRASFSFDKNVWFRPYLYGVLKKLNFVKS